MPSRYEFRSVVWGVETLPTGLSMPRHHHDEGYATVVLAGLIHEAGFAGRMSAQPGDVLLRGRFDCHLDRAGSRRTLQILRLPWRHDSIEGLYRVTDPDALVRLCEIDPQAAAAQLTAAVRCALDGLGRRARRGAQRRVELAAARLGCGAQPASRCGFAHLRARVRRLTEALPARVAHAPRLARDRRIAPITHRDCAPRRLCRPRASQPQRPRLHRPQPLGLAGRARRLSACAPAAAHQLELSSLDAMAANRVPKAAHSSSQNRLASACSRGRSRSRSRSTQVSLRNAFQTSGAVFATG